jgi:hypothetical protein
MLRPWLADVKLCANCADRGNPVCGKLLSEQFGCLFPQRVRFMSAVRLVLRWYLRTPDDHHKEFA